MDATYREIAPSPNLAPFIECFWIGKVLQDFVARVVPDGCADILFLSRENIHVETQFVGVMTRPRLVPLAAGVSLLGVRFHPGMAGACLACDMPAFGDRIVPFQLACRVRADDLVHTVGRHSFLEGRITAIENWFHALPGVSSTQQAIRELVGHNGQLALDDFAQLAGVSARQLRRTCRQQSGLSPKQLARVLRFRQAVGRLRGGETALTRLALDCGYYDQAHLNREFRALAGISPTRYLRQNSR